MEIDGLLINGQNAFETYGAIMGDDFLNALDAPAGLKDFITFDSRTANGTEYLIKDSSNNPYARVKARDLTLKFRLFGADVFNVFSTTKYYVKGEYVKYSGNYYRFKADHTGAWSSSDVDSVSGATDTLTTEQRQANLQSRKAALLAAFQAGIVTIKVPSLNSNTYKLLYTGQSISYDLSTDRTTCAIGAKFVEPNPTDRTTA